MVLFQNLEVRSSLSIPFTSCCSSAAKAPPAFTLRFVSDRVQGVFRGDEPFGSLHRQKPLGDFVPDLIFIADKIQKEQLHDPNELKINWVALIVQPAILPVSSTPFRKAKRPTGRIGLKEDNPLLTSTALPIITVNRDPELEQELGSIAFHVIPFLDGSKLLPQGACRAEAAVQGSLDCRLPPQNDILAVNGDKSRLPGHS